MLIPAFYFLLFTPEVVDELNARRTEMLIVVLALQRVVDAYLKGRATYNRYLLTEDAAARVRGRYRDYLYDLANLLLPDDRNTFLLSEVRLRQGIEP